jgi:RNA polymerase sigma factor (sigma-70 family)
VPPTAYNITELDLVEGCKRGETACFRDLYQNYSKAMYNTCLRLVGNREDAEDVLQESFSKAFENIKSFQHQSTFGTWLKRIVINNSIDFLRKRKLNFISIDQVTETELVEDDMQAIQFSVSIILRALNKLVIGYRTVLSLHLFEGYKHEEIAALMGISHSTVRTQYFRGKAKLLLLLKEESHE